MTTKNTTKKYTPAQIKKFADAGRKAWITRRENARLAAKQSTRSSKSKTSTKSTRSSRSSSSTSPRKSTRTSSSRSKRS